MMNKLVADRYLRFPINIPQASRPQNPAFPPGFREGVVTLLNIEESESEGMFGMGRRISQISGGGHPAKAHRSFRWLPYVPGQVTFLPLAGPELLTGKMSGCWITIFLHGGVPYVAHIGTELASNTPNSLAAKNAWNNAVANRQITFKYGFNPVGPDLPGTALTRGTKAKEFFAAVDAMGGLWTAVLGVANDPGLRKIYTVQRMPPRHVVQFM